MSASDPDQRTNLMTVGEEVPPKVPDHEMVRRIGAGAYGEVWLARSVLGACRAVKVVYRKTFRDARPYEREFSGIKKFEPISRDHAGLVAILHVGRNDAEGYFYYVMELADDLERGSDFDAASYRAKTLAAEIGKRGRIPAVQCLRIAERLVAGLGHLHSNGLIHRDIKPANIIFVRGEAKLADIGLVTEADEAVSFVGTLGYIPPEGPGTGQADIFSLGKVIGELVQTKAQIRELDEAPEPQQSAPGDLARLKRVVARACDPDVRTRYASAGEMLAELQGESRRHRTLPLKLLATGVAAFVLATTAFWFSRRAAPEPRPSTSNSESPGVVVRQFNKTRLAVLPFENYSASRQKEEFEYFGDAITDEVISKLSRVSGLKVKPHSAVMKYKGAERDLRKIGQELGVGAILEANFQREGNKLRVRVKLIDPESEEHIWLEDYDKQFEDVLTIETQVAESVAEALRVALLPREIESVRRRPTANLEAYDKYLRAGPFYGIRNDRLDRSVELLEQALALDGDFAEAQAALAVLYVQKGYFDEVQNRTWDEKAEAAARRALDMNPELPEGHLALARLAFRPAAGFDFDTAFRETHQAVRLRPYYDDAHAFLGTIYYHVGLLEESRQQHVQVLEYNPENLIARNEIAHNDLMQGNYASAAKRFEKVGREVGGLYQMGRTIALVYSGQTNEALAALESFSAATQPETGARKDVGGILHGTKALLAALTGKRAEAHAAIADAERYGQGFGHFHHTAAVLADAYSVLGEIDASLRWLTYACDNGFPNLVWFERDPALQNLRRDPRFRQLIDRLEPKCRRFKAMAQRHSSEESVK